MGTPDSSNTPNQATFTDTQNFDVDIDQLYKSWIVPLDNIRSYSSINAQNAAIIKSLEISKAISGLIKPEKTLQESRCHAFYRWIGFPVRGNGQIYNPGFDIIRDSSRSITDKTKTNIANNPLDGFNKLSVERETFSQNNLIIFSLPGTTNSGVLALSSGGNSALRKFITPFDKDDTPFDTNVSNQSYQVDFKVRVGKSITTLDKFKNQNGDSFNASGSKTVTTKRTHIIKPFLVDPRIDFAVSPQSRLIAIPFVLTKDQTKVDEVNFVKRPLLENIITNRFTVDDPTVSAGTFTNKVLQIISDFPDIKDNALVQLAADPNNLLKRSEQIQLGDAINTVKSLMQKLVDAQNTIKMAQGQYYWLPSPSTSGPEGGCKVQGVFIPTVIGKELVTSLDSKIFFAQLRDSVNKVTRAGNEASGQSQATAADFGLPANQITFGPDTTDALGDNNAQNLDTLTANRFRVLTDASDALRTIEIIMGDFSGFGLCDIVAIIGSLNVIPKENLVSFLDDDAKTRMLNTLGLSSSDVQVPGFEEASKALAKSVKDFYNLMDKIYQDILNNGSTA